MKRARIISAAYNVVVAIDAVSSGDELCYNLPGGKSESITASTDIPIFHKAARRSIGAGEKIIKYGEHIGEASQPIASGEHVHTHNVKSVREDL